MHFKLAFKPQCLFILCDGMSFAWIRKKMATAVPVSYQQIIAEFKRSEYYRCSTGRTFFFDNEIEPQWFEYWKGALLQPALNVLASQSSNKKTFLAQFPAEILKWDRMVSASATALRGPAPLASRLPPAEIWNQIFTFIIDKINKVRQRELPKADDDILMGMCMRSAQGAMNPCFLALCDDMELNAYHRESHAASAGRIVGIIRSMSKAQAPILQKNVMDMIMVFTSMCLRSPEPTMMRDLIVSYLHHIRLKCE